MSIFAIGDIHGDSMALFHVLCELTESCTYTVDFFSKLDDESKRQNYENIEKFFSTINWKAGCTNTLVFCGDLVDRKRGYSSVDNEYNDMNILNLLYKLQEQAKKNGGEIKLCVGNHEQMNLFYPHMNERNPYLMQDHSTINPKNLYDFVKNQAHRDKTIIDFVTNFNVINVIDNLIFMHAGFHKGMIKFVEDKKMDYNLINLLFKKHLLNTYSIKHELENEELLKTFTSRFYGAYADVIRKHQQILGDNENSLLWNRSLNEELSTCRVDYDYLQNALKLLRGGHDNDSELKLILGHCTNSDNEVNNVSTCNGQILFIDTGMSRAFDINLEMERKYDKEHGQIICVQLTKNTKQNEPFYEIKTQKKFAREVFKTLTGLESNSIISRREITYKNKYLEIKEKYLSLKKGGMKKMKNFSLDL